MYVPGPNAVDDHEMVLGLLRSAGVGHLIASDAAGVLDATLLPFLVDDELTCVRAHLARANPQWRTIDTAAVMMIVPVSDAYVSPAWYPSKRDEPRVVPTWNYEVVHLHGTVSVRDDPAFVERVVRELTTSHEAARTASHSVPAAWSVDDAPAEFISRQLRAIVGIELKISSIDAKRKLSQNRSDADQHGVADGLELSTDARNRDVATAMRQNHDTT